MNAFQELLFIVLYFEVIPAMTICVGSCESLAIVVHVMFSAGHAICKCRRGGQLQTATFHLSMVSVFLI